MFCLGCNYPLRGLSASTCPECNRAFCATDPTTFRESLDISTLFEKTLLWCIGLTLLPWFIGLACACIAYITLGYWPRPMQDDPKGIAVVSFIQPVFLISFVVGFAAWSMLIGFAMLMARLAYRERSSRPLAFAVSALACVVLAVVLLRTDPFSILNWLND